jgi:hypothetical protein
MKNRCYYSYMASFEQRFRAVQRENPYHSSLINFNRALKLQDLSFSRRVFYFKKLVEKDDYAKEDYKSIRDAYCEKGRSFTQKTATQEYRFSSSLGAKKAGILPRLALA